ncbi:hypothetical protein JCM6882_001687, partial [Rhodosporidiobolus microsporus]
PPALLPPPRQIRYGSLHIRGAHITLKWQPDDLTFVLSGQYGL